MKYRFAIVVVVFISTLSVAQEPSKKEGVVLINPITWGTMVYKRAKNSTMNTLIKEFAAVKKQPFHLCNSNYDRYEHWYCDSKPDIAFQAIDGNGELRNEVMLCQTNKFFKEYKYFNKEIFIQYNCLVASWWPEVDAYEFHTVDEWLGGSCE